MKSTRRIVVAAFAAVALVPALTAGSSSATTAYTTTFKGRFVCGDRPLADARVELVGEPRDVPVLFGMYGPTTKGFLASGPQPIRAGPDGEWSFTVPRTARANYYLRVSLDDGRGTRVADGPSAAPASSRTDGTNLDNVVVHDYHTQSYGGDECALWLALKDEYAAYANLMGKRPPYGELVAEYDGPNDGVPYTAYTTIVWPRGYPVDEAAVRHEFAHTIRNASLRSPSAFLDEVSQVDFRRPHSPCRRTTAQYAFHEGWAYFWAGDFHPAPLCVGDQETHDPAIEGAVGWELTRLERTCAAASRRRMVQVLLDRGPTIHSLADFERALGVSATTCSGTTLRPGDVPRYRVAPAVSDDLWQRDIRSSLNSARHRDSALRALLPGAERAAVSARCPSPPCTSAVARKVTPDLIRGLLAQTRLLKSTFAAQVSPKARAELVRPPTRAFLNRVTTVPRTLSRRLAGIGVTSIDRALAAARPLARRDASRRTRALVAALVSQRRVFARAARSGVGLPPWVIAGASTSKTHVAPTRHLVTFNGIPDGTQITTQTARVGVSFGSAAALAFRGRPPAYVCAAGPSAAQDAAVAPACDSPTAGFVYNGTLARLVSSARTVAVRVGATEAIPGGLPVEIDAFDGAGELVTRNAVLVGSSTNGQGAGPVTSLSVTVPRRAAIRFIAIFVNTLISSRSRLVFDDVGFTE